MAFKHVLIIDDDEEDTEIFTAALTEASRNVDCSVAHDATEALRKLESNVLSPDVIFLDLNMPVMTGQQFLKEIKSRPALNDIPVVIFSTSSNPATIKETRELGAANFVTKPERFKDLIETLKQIFD